ncbi:hypothetical protein, partial [Proteus faecis]|uniref:hypothetical protein n=1 Tax=Proteus faecis TaxID=2050967 RepID=UPI003075B56C
VVGSVNGRNALDALLIDATNGALRALAALGLEASQSLGELPAEPRVNFPWPIFPHPKGKEFVDFDEDLQVRDIVNATRHG